MYPKISRSPLYRVTIPEFSAGVNYRDGASMVDDNQLTDVKNMWYKNGMLRTRPGLTADEKSYFSITKHEDGVVNGSNNIKLTDVYRTVDGVKQRLIIAITQNEDSHPNRAKFVFVGEDGSLTHLSPLDYYGYEVTGVSIGMCGNLENCIAFMKKDTLYLLTKYENNSGPYGFKYDFDNDKWIVLKDDDYYAPTIFTNGKAQNVISGDKNYSVNGDMLEGYNLIGNKYKVYFDGYSSGGASRFVIPTSSDDFKKLVVRHTDKNNDVHEHSIILFNGYYVYSDLQKDGAKVQLAGTNGCLAVYFVNSSDSVLSGFANDQGLQNNLEITVYTKSKYYDVSRCSISTWYGGNASGLSGGTRLFVAGDVKYPNRVLWSDLNNPLYFPENNYAYIGNDDQAVTAFGKQGEKLVIFKEREIYYTYYVVGDSVTAEDVINQNVIDLAANSAIFPIVQIHSEIGCDCPNTVALCQNRLVWATSDGKVYTLASNNQYSERNVVEISALLGYKLREVGVNQFKTAFAADCDEHYYLSVGNKMFVLDYGNNGLSYMASYGGYDSALKRLSWYYWTVPCNDGIVASCGQTMVLLENISSRHQSYCYSFTAVYRFDEEKHEDASLMCVPGENYSFTLGKDTYLYETTNLSYIKINNMLKTKCFDFSRPDKNKKIGQVYISLGDGLESVIVSFGTDNDVIDSRTLRKTDQSKTEIFRILPQLPRVSHFDIKMECNGAFCLDGISINYKPLGSVM